MDILKRHGFREETAGMMEAKSAKKISELLGMTDDELNQSGNPPLSVTAEFTDGDGNVYRGTLSLVTGKE